MAETQAIDRNALRKRLLKARVSAAQEAEGSLGSSIDPNAKIGLRVGGAVLRVPADYSEEERRQVVENFRQTPEFDRLIDKRRGAPSFVRAMVGSAKTPEDQLATLQNYFPDAFRYGQTHNFVFTNPETGKPTLYNPSGFEMGDVSEFARSGFEMVGSVGGAALGFASPVPGGTYLGAGGGAVAGGEAFDLLAETFGDVIDTRSVGRKTLDMSLDFAFGAAGEGLGRLAEKGVKAGLRGAKVTAQKAQALRQNFERFQIRGTAGGVTGSRTLGTLEQTLEATPGGSGVMQDVAEQVVKDVENAVDRIARSVGTPRTPHGVGETVRRAAQKTLDVFKNKQGQVYDDVFDRIGAETLVPLENLQKLRTELSIELNGAPNSLGPTLKPVIQQIDNLIGDVQFGPGRSGIPFESLRSVRTMIGKNLAEPLSSNATAAQNVAMKRIYASLTEDMSAAAASTSPQVARKLANADKMTRIWAQGHKETMQKILATGSDEKIWTFIQTAKKDNASALRRMRRRFESDEWDELVATVLSRMGQQPGDKGIESFSINTFLTNWNKRMSPEAKKILFSGRYNGLDSSLDDLVELMTNIQKAEATANRSNTARNLIMFNLLSAFGGGVGAAATGDVSGAGVGVGGAVLSSVLAPRVAARLITSPKFIRWLSTPVPRANGLGAHLGKLVAISESSPELADDIAQFLNAIRSTPEAQVEEIERDR